MTSRMWTRQAAASLLWSLSACAGAGLPPCATSSECDEGEVCSPAGRCDALTARRFVPTFRVDPIDWAVVPVARPTTARALGDTLLVGGPDGLRALLTFPRDDLRGDAATLVLEAHPDWTGPTREGTLVVRAARSFRGPTLAAGEGAPTPRLGRASRRFAAGHRGRFLVSLTPSLGDALPTTLEVLLEGGGAEPWRFASPDGLDAYARPHVELDGFAPEDEARGTLDAATGRAGSADQL